MSILLVLCALSISFITSVSIFLTCVRIKAKLDLAKADAIDDMIKYDNHH